MAIQIIDGTGSGQSVGVSPTGNRFNVSSRTDERIYYISRDNGDAYAWASGTYSATGDDTILILTNTSTTQKLYITKMTLFSLVKTRFIVHCPTASFTDSGTNIVGTNLNRTSGNTASATATRDEINNVQGDIVWTGDIPILGNPFEIRFHDALILGQGDSVGIDYVTTSSAVDITILGFFDVE